MHFLKRLFDFYINSSIHVAIAVTCLVYITDFSNDLCKHIVYPITVFFATIIAYNFLKYYRVFFKSKGHYKKYYAILIVTLISSVGFLFTFLMLKSALQIPIVITGLLVLIYPFLRKYGWLKIFLVSFVVTIISVYIPFILVKPILLDFYISLTQRFFILISLLIPFEILDSKTDAISLQTLPQKFGIKSAKLFGILLVIPFMLFEFLKVNYSFVVLPIGMITVLFIYFSSLERNKYYTSFWVESIPIFWLLLLVVFG
jgi:hypothetical protein